MRPVLASQLLGWTKSNPMLDSWREDVSGLLRAWIAALRSRSRQIRSARGVTDPRLERAFNWLDAHYSSHATLRDFAAQAGLSPWHAARMLKQETGRTFMAHLNQRRVSEAEHLLSETTFSVKEIAARVGYAGSSQLGRHFKRLRGRPPATHRRTRQQSTSNSNN
jgi:transcriptional regulator GlxA family with amidase domain